MKMLLIENRGEHIHRVADIVKEISPHMNLLVLSSEEVVLKYMSHVRADIVVLNSKLFSISVKQIVDIVKVITDRDDIQIVFMNAGEKHSKAAAELNNCICICGEDEELVRRSLKPVLLEWNRNNLQKFYFRKLGNTKGISVISRNKDVVIVFPEEILFVERVDKHIRIVTIGGEVETRDYGVQSFVEQVNRPDFSKTHKSFAVNLRYVRKVEKIEKRLWQISFLIQPEKKALLSATYYKEVSSQLCER